MRLYTPRADLDALVDRTDYIDARPAFQLPKDGCNYMIRTRARSNTENESLTLPLKRYTLSRFRNQFWPGLYRALSTEPRRYEKNI